MELKEFVKKALIELMSAVREAATEMNAEASHGMISPRLQPSGQWAGTGVAEEDGGGVPFLVDFDLSVVVTENERSSAEGSAKLTIASLLSLGGSGVLEEGQAKVATQRLRFSVPVRYPQTRKGQISREFLLASTAKAS